MSAASPLRASLQQAWKDNHSRVLKQASPVRKERKRRNYFDDLSSMVKSKLGELLLNVAEEELMIERQRQQLASLREFEPYSAFTRIDRDRKEYISTRDLVSFIR